MSKSLGNFFTVREVLEQFHAETVRFFLLSSHYRSPVNFSDTALKEAHQSLSRLYHALKAVDGVIEIDPLAWQSEAGLEFTQAMNDDFNTAKAISVLFGLAGEINRAIKAEDKATAQKLAVILKTLASALNIAQDQPSEFLQASIDDGAISESEILAQIAKRTKAKKDKDFALADQIRASLKKQGVELEDSREGTSWRRILV